MIMWFVSFVLLIWDITLIDYMLIDYSPCKTKAKYTKDRLLLERKEIVRYFFPGICLHCLIYFLVS